MLRPPAHTSNSFSRLVRSPRIKPTDDDHPLTQEGGGHDDGKVAFSTSVLGSSIPYLARANSFTPRTESPANAGIRNEDNRNLKVRSNDTEVYVHHVAAGDTLPKIILQYQIPVHVLRKANKLWANDSIQSKAFLLLPVKACGIRPQLVDYFSPQVEPSTTSTVEGSSLLSPSPPRQSSNLAGSPKRAAAGKHKVVRQVSINGIGLVDVALVRGATLSYFPPSSSPSPYHDAIALSNTGTDYEAHERDERSSFDSIRIGAGQIAANAYNGTQGLIRRLKDKKQIREIDLIDL
ncbi:Putative uncharacterized protein [Taphrina deformans PYCC 5710]|uniref:LysM domain-containing protein n=1 Tax=Taphrina deformans (strain PYCC 5710 / ATCC 11124 / CBS 356.35 / IMI 108563 / JCM 9778 / NBRC 8474) TaxID=1097556 RepID=R4XC92_TAPDE|nr:Putative uncharacterized protein [Taphrina deformans PYCC 5710]|eukprot:CCG83492.1 Putative uncharacterized protein [Taphrina deformans PYCC 5710]